VSNEQETESNNGLKLGAVFNTGGKGLPLEFASQGLNTKNIDSDASNYDESVWKGNGANAVHFIKIKALAGKSYD
jgi:hypothetical protein